MASVYVKPFGSDGEFNCSFLITDGVKEIGAESWMVDDEISLVFTIPEEIHKAINRMEFLHVRSHGNTMGNAPFSVHMKFKVVKRSHGAMWKDTGKLLSLGSSIWLEALNRTWEEVFRWVCLGEKPDWAEGE